MIQSEAEGTMSGAVLLDAASARQVAPNVIELRLVMEARDAGTLKGLIDNRVQFDCTGGRQRLMHVDIYDAAKTVQLTQGAEDWAPLLAHHPLNRFVCKGERDGFVRRDGYTPPLG